MRGMEEAPVRFGGVIAGTMVVAWIATLAAGADPPAGGELRPVPGRETPWSRAAAEGTSANAENIFSGAEDGHAAIQSWWHSPGHHKNMLGGQQRTGLGRWKRFWTQLFG